MKLRNGERFWRYSKGIGIMYILADGRRKASSGCYEGLFLLKRMNGHIQQLQTWLRSSRSGFLLLCRPEGLSRRSSPNARSLGPPNASTEPQAQRAGAQKRADLRCRRKKGTARRLRWVPGCQRKMFGMDGHGGLRPPTWPT